MPLVYELSDSESSGEGEYAIPFQPARVYLGGGLGASEGGGLREEEERSSIGAMTRSTVPPDGKKAVVSSATDALFQRFRSSLPNANESMYNANHLPTQPLTQQYPTATASTTTAAPTMTSGVSVNNAAAPVITSRMIGHTNGGNNNSSMMRELDSYPLDSSFPSFVPASMATATEHLNLNSSGSIKSNMAASARERSAAMVAQPSLSSSTSGMSLAQAMFSKRDAGYESDAGSNLASPSEEFDFPEINGKYRVLSKLGEGKFVYHHHHHHPSSIKPPMQYDLI